ncbi:PASTA domain-containing protein [Clavibacter tessellarius]|uniref:PASTA domain-containing protein n=1 Tax=Clavibacter tessellarius TaxID=31965 RepID=UPI0039EA659A
MPDVPSAAPAGWFPDGSGQLRYWDGSAWTQHVAPMVQPAAPQAQAPSAAALAAVAAAQQAEQAKAARAADAARVQAERAAVAEQHRAAKVAQREAAMQAKAAERAQATRARSAQANTVAVSTPASKPARKARKAVAAPVAPVVPAAPTAVLTDTRPSRHPATTWVIAAVVALAVLITTAVGGFGGMFVSVGLVALVTALYPLFTGRRSWVPALATRPRNSATAAGAILLLIIGAAVPVAASAPGPRPAEAISASASPTPSPTPTPSATPTPVVHVVEDVSAKTATDARSLLREAGYVVQYVLDSGEKTALTNGMTVKSQSPAPGSRVDAGSTVTLTLLAPAPAPTVEPTVAPAPAPVAPAPAPKPAAPAPAPVAPAPAPAAPAPAPEPAQQTGGINPGGFCSSVGAVAQADNGRSYKCGGKGPDASGKYHWNTM